ncbi:hypothetical protein H7992_14390 [Sporosarcina sp. resist]|uniref:hypothetical protein n=1 Tax=Sporosarcina sp. resist TaxID=2762563 RepID=UPI00164E6BCF|nr:hypothetical protein [Sporosarcina sp. resist]QNK86448.1 hypothetical protein H7992_14390 [Sporosarcina sp. resist]
MNIKKINKIRKREFNKITKKHERKLLLRAKANEELDIIINSLSKEIKCEKKLLKEVVFHLEALQKELNYFGYRGIGIGIVVVVLTNFFTTQGIPIMYEALEEIDKFSFTLEKIIYLVIYMLFFLFLVGTFGFVLWKTLSPFFGDDKDIREQIYIYEYMIKIVESKIKQLE